MSREQEVAQSWEANADAWTRVVRTGRIESRRLATDAALTEAILRSGARSLLDVGCGEGWLARALARHGLDVTGFDAVPALVDGARSLGGGAFKVLSYEEAARDPELLGGPFDAAACNFSLLGEVVVPLLRARKRRLSDTGTLFVQTVHPLSAACDGSYEDGWRTETFTTFGDAAWQPMPWYFRTVGSWIGALSEAGFRVEACIEPLHPDAGRPLSLLLVCRCVRATPGEPVGALTNADPA